MNEPRDLTDQLRALGERPIDPARAADDLAAMAAVSDEALVVGPDPRRTGFWTRARVGAAFLAGLLIGGTGLASADALPDPAQRVAHSVLGTVGIDVPKPERYHGPECGSEVKRNHGAYVRDNKELAQTECGKKVKTPGESDDAGKGDKAGKEAKGPCQGPPPWARDKTMTSEAKAAAEAAREAQCPDDDEADKREDEADDDQGEDITEPTTDTTTASTTASTAATTTTASTVPTDTSAVDSSTETTDTSI